MVHHPPPVLVERACHRTGREAQHVCVDHRGAYIGVAEQFLHRADIGAALQQVGGERVA